MHQRCGGCEEEKRETQVGSGSVSEDTDGCKNDPNLVGILQMISVESKPSCEMASEWTSMPQPLVVDSGAAETVVPRTWFPSHKTVESEGSKRGVFNTTADGSTVEHEGETTLIMPAANGAQMRKVTFSSGKRQQRHFGSVSKMVRNGNRVRHVRVTHREQDDERHAVAPGKRRRVRCGHDCSTARKQKSEPLFGRPGCSRACMST